MRNLKNIVLKLIDESRPLTKSDGFDLLRAITEAELADHARPAPAPPPAPSSDRAGGDIAVIGLGCRMPRADNPSQLWQNLIHGCDAVGAYPAHRMVDVIRTKRELWNAYAEKVQRPATPLLGGWLERIDAFDRHFFEMNRVDATTRGPAERLFLQTAWQAFEDAGYGRSSLQGSRTGIYLAHSPEVPLEYARLLPAGDPQAVPFNNPGSTAYGLAHWLDFRGPTMVVNTTCSSSLVATHAACQALRAGECDMALAGGISLFLFPYFYDTSDPMRLLAPDGRCKAFDAAANGLSMGEGIGLVVLKPLSRAVEDGDFIYGVLKGSAINSDGRSNGVTAPNPAAQTDAIVRAWENAKVDPRDVSYVEAHGAGTPLGDPIEVKGLTDAFRRYTDEKQFCGLGSIKANISHLGDAAGISGLIKVLLSLHHRTLPALLHYRQPSPFMSLADSPLRVVEECSPWKERNGVRLAGVSSFGISGTNCHMIVAEHTPEPAATARHAPHVLTVSARSLGSLWRLLGEWETYLARMPEEAIDAICASALRRDAYEYRAAIMATSVQDLRLKVARLGQLRHLERLPPAFSAQGIYASRVAQENSTAYSELPRDDSNIETRLVRAFLTEPSLDVASFFADGIPTKVPVPTYCFDEERIWPEHEVPEVESFEPYFYDLHWIERARFSQSDPAALARTWLVLGDDAPLCRAIRTRLRQAGGSIILVHAGTVFHRKQNAMDELEFTIDPSVPRHFERLAQELAGAPITGMIHMWTCRPHEADMDDAESMTHSQDVGVLSVFRLVRALHAASLFRQGTLLVATAYAHGVDGNEPVVLPVRVTAAGFAKVLSQEVPHMATATVDLDICSQPVDALAEQMLEELQVPPAVRDELVAFRGGRRYVKVLDHSTDAECSAAPLPRIKEGGVYFLAGGTGYLGIQMALYLARHANVKIALCSRTKLPARETWNALLSAQPDSTLAYQLSGIAEAERLGSEVIHVPADVTDAVQIRDAIERVRRRFGRIDGVVVAQKQLAHLPIHTIPEDDFVHGIMNRVHGTWFIDQATRRDTLDFFIVLSSISSLMGTKTASECCAVNQYLDEYPAYAAPFGRRVSVMNLTLILDDQRDFRGPSPIPPLTFREFFGCMDSFLRRLPRLAVIAKFDPEEVGYLLPVLRIPFADAVLRTLGIRGDDREQLVRPASEAEGPRDASQTAVPPLVEIERTLVDLCGELLGERITNSDESFFDIGGTSLTALKLVKLVRERFAIKFEASDIYAAPELAALARRIHGTLAPDADPIDRLLDGVRNGSMSVDAALHAALNDARFLK